MTQVLQSILYCIMLIPVHNSAHNSGSKNHALILNFQLNHKLTFAVPFSFSPTPQKTEREQYIAICLSSAGTCVKHW